MFLPHVPLLPWIWEAYWLLCFPPVFQCIEAASCGECSWPEETEVSEPQSRSCEVEEEGHGQQSTAPQQAAGKEMDWVPGVVGDSTVQEAAAVAAAARAAAAERLQSHATTLPLSPSPANGPLAPPLSFLNRLTAATMINKNQVKGGVKRGSTLDDSRGPYSMHLMVLVVVALFPCT
jgi:hypothetical protein